MLLLCLYLLPDSPWSFKLIAMGRYISYHITHPGLTHELPYLTVSLACELCSLVDTVSFPVSVVATAISSTICFAHACAVPFMFVHCVPHVLRTCPWRIYTYTYQRISNDMNIHARLARQLALCHLSSSLPALSQHCVSAETKGSVHKHP